MALHCEAQGYPQPKFEWFKDGMLIDNSDLMNFLRTHYMIQNRETKSEFVYFNIFLYLVIFNFF